VPFADPPEILLSRWLFTIRKSRSIRAALRPDELHTVYTYSPIPTQTYKYIIYMCYILFFYFIVILLYYIPPITYYHCGGSSGGWRVRRYFYIGDIYDRVKDLLSISGLSLSSFALTAYFSVYTTITYILHTAYSLSRHPSYVYYIYVCVSVSVHTAVRSFYALAGSHHENRLITTVMRAEYIYIYMCVCRYYNTRISYYYIRQRIPPMLQPS